MKPNRLVVLAALIAGVAAVAVLGWPDGDTGGLTPTPPPHTRTTAAPTTSVATLDPTSSTGTTAPSRPARPAGFESGYHAFSIIARVAPGHLEALRASFPVDGARLVLPINGRPKVDAPLTIERRPGPGKQGSVIGHYRGWAPPGTYQATLHIPGFLEKRLSLRVGPKSGVTVVEGLAPAAARVLATVSFDVPESFTEGTLILMAPPLDLVSEDGRWMAGAPNTVATLLQGQRPVVARVRVTGPAQTIRVDLPLSAIDSGDLQAIFAATPTLPRWLKYPEGKTLLAAGRVTPRPADSDAVDHLMIRDVVAPPAVPTVLGVDSDSILQVSDRGPDHWPPGSLNGFDGVAVIYEGAARAVRPFRRRAGPKGESLHIEPPRWTSISGVVTNENGTPLPNATLVHQFKIGKEYHRNFAKANEEGKFEFRHSEPTPPMVSVHAMGHRQLSVQLPPESPPGGLQIQLRRR